jgi:hypothetical protein
MVQVTGELDTVAAGLTVQQAAVAAGVSERTIRRRIKEGILAAEKVPTAQGYEWRVQLDGGACLPDRSGRRVDDDRVDGGVAPSADGVDSVAEEVGEALVRALGLVERLQRENLELAGRVGFLQGKLQETQAQLLALAPPVAAPGAAPAVPAAEPLRGGLRAFWRRLWHAEGQRAGV